MSARLQSRSGRGADPDGLLLVDKPAGPTSHDIVDAVRRLFHFRKVGHGGTLDPGATGLLVLLIGRATKVSQVVMAADKEYEGSMLLGVTTDTHDADGAVVRRRDPSSITRERLAEEFRKWTGDIEQVPPMVSAVKKEGVALYKLARHGESVEREPRVLHIYEFALLEFHPPLARFRVRCSKGTYVRTLCHDVGEALGCGACLNTLRRTRSGPLDVAEAVPFESLVDLSPEQLAPLIRPLSSISLRAAP
ncbi:MAG: tRNA pseudouridine(55) synthase TruB [Kiritimatiellae bacterium]|nr:tRNA pseudouridine(55) synthase TruB [Kiritimatiellia bacterium]MDW8457837.1 tRNA pseudouridine(55) synthase TruB [Verrucomicrobiota bacterium]